MTRRLALAWTCLLVAATSAEAQIPFSKDSIPSTTALARLGLKRQWYGVVPLTGPERVASVSLDGDMLFVQTTQSNFHAFQAETGRFLWSAHLGSFNLRSFPASTNSIAVYVTNSNKIFALSKQTGQLIWSRTLDESAAGPTACDEERVYIGLITGVLQVYNAANGKHAWQVSTNGALVSRTLPAGRMVAFADSQGKVFISRSEFLEPLIRWSAVGPIVAPLASHGARTLLIPSKDKSIYAIDIFSGDTIWNFPTGAPIELEPLVTDDDVYVVNNEGRFSSLDVKTGSPRWTISTLGGPLLSVSAKRIYLESRDGDLFTVDRATGNIISSPRETKQRAGANFRDFEFGPTNRTNDRLYLCTKSGLLLCLREVDQVKPRLLRDPKEKPIGYVPPGGYPDIPLLPPPPATDDATTEKPAADPAAAAETPVETPVPAPAPGAKPQ